MRTVLDLTHPLAEDMPVYPGCRPPRIRQDFTVARDGYAEKTLELQSHTGTHIDAPAHMLAGAPTLDRLGPDRFVGPACVLDARAGSLDEAFLEAHRDLVEGCDFVLLHTGWDRHWGTPAYFQGFPVLTAGGAAWLAARRLKGVGVDAISPDPVGSEDFPVHRAILGSGALSVENLTGLGPLAGRRFLFACLPLAIPEADGSPVRAVAILEDPTGDGLHLAGQD